jgi:GTP-binding protein
VVAIVGRPNTGKSTLFNRLVGGRVAITLQEPGITRDRIIRDAEWLGRRFRVVDTGGLIPNSKEEIAREVERQVAIALAEAKVIVLVVDGASGLQPMDEEIARRLRKQDRQFIVAVNKLDQRRSFDSADFHRLGADALIPISAELGTGIDELLEAVFERLPEAPKRRAEHILSLAILGRPNVGKSSLLNRLLGAERSIVTAIPGTTRDVVEELLEHDGRLLRLLDTAGIRRKPKVHEPVEYYSVTRAIDQLSRCDVAIVMFDAFDGPNNQDKRIINLVTERGRGMVVFANKMDTVPAGKKEPVRDWVNRELSFVGYAPVIFGSVLKGQGVDKALRTALSVWDSGGVQIPNAELRRAVMPRVERNQPRSDSRVLALSQTGTRPPAFRLRLSNPKAMSAAYERFVLGEIRRRFRFPGYPVRLHATR